MAIQQMAYVEPAALQDMSKKIEKLKDELRKMVQQLNTEAENLHQSGFQDRKFEELRNRVRQSDADIKNLIAFMERFMSYLIKQEKIIEQYLGSRKL